MSPSDAMRELTCDEVREMAGAFVLGALDAADEGALRAHLATCSEAHEEIAELGSVIPAFFQVVPVVEPPEALKARIMAAAEADLAVRTVSAGTAAAPIAFPGSQQRAKRRVGASTGGWLVRIAAVLVIVALGGWNLLLRDELSAAQQYERSVAAVLDTAARPGSLSAILAADGGPGSGLAAVDTGGHVALAMHDLAPTSGNSVYEAWVIGGDGVPVPIGSFQVGTAGTAFFESSGLPSTDGIVLALTREPGPGATTPTMPIISKGVATASG